MSVHSNKKKMSSAHVSCQRRDGAVVALLFAGCGWMHPFEFGVGKAFAEVVELSSPCVRLGGCSAGAAVSSGLALGLDMDVFFEETLTLYDTCRHSPLGMCGGVKRVMQHLSPGDAPWQRASGKLAIGLSAVGFGGCSVTCTPECVSHFRDAAHAIELVRASCHLPVVGGILPYTVDGHPCGYYDGGLSMLVPDIAAIPEMSATGEVFSVKVDGRPLVRGIDIVPDLGFTVPIAWSYIPRKPPILREIYRLGYLRAAEFMLSEPTLGKVSHVVKPDFAVGTKGREALLARVRTEVPPIRSVLAMVSRGESVEHLLPLDRSATT